VSVSFIFANGREKENQRKFPENLFEVNLTFKIKTKHTHQIKYNKFNSQSCQIRLTAN